jgi:anti-anti-sigma factor
MLGDPPGAPSAEPDRPGLGLRDANTHVPPVGGKPPIMDQPFDADSLYALREAVAAHAAQAGLSDGRVVDLVLAVHELAANAVRHGAGHGRLRIWTTDGALRCEITDDGAPDKSVLGDGAPGDGPPGEVAPADEASAGESALWPIAQGHGLWLVRQVADQATLDSGPSGTVAAVSFTLGPPGSVAPFGIDQRVEGGCAVVVVTGQLDLGSAGQFAAVVDGLIASSGTLRLVVDLSGLTLWDSSGLAALVAAQYQVGAAPPDRMVLAGLPGSLAERLRDIGVADRFTLAASTAEALGLLTPPGEARSGG